MEQIRKQKRKLARKVRGKLAMFREVRELSVFKFIKWNYLSGGRVRRDPGKYLYPCRGAVLCIDPSARINLHANLYVNCNKFRHSREETWVRMERNAELTINGTVRLCSRMTVLIHEGAKVNIGRAYFNHETTLAAGYRMDIGDDIMVARGACIFDSDFHAVLDEDGNQTNLPRPLVIGNHVWIGLRAILLRGSRVGDGAVISAGALVAGRIKPGTMAFGSPARSYSKINWRG